MWINQWFPLFDQSTANARSLRKFAEYENSIQWQDVFINFMQVVLNMFEWKNLPDTCNSRALERTLFFDGKCLFFKDPIFGFRNSQVNLDQGLDFYGENVMRTAIAANGYNKRYSNKNSVLIRNNDYLWPTVFNVQIMTEKVVSAARSIDVYSNNMKHPLLLRAEKDDQLTIQNIVAQKDKNEYVVLINKQHFNQGDLEPVDISIPADGLKELWQHKRNLIDEFYTRYGINNVGNNKKERLITSEAESNSQILEINIDLMYDKRKDACNQINEMFGLNVDVDLKLDQLTIHDSILQDVPRGTTGGNNG